MIDFVKQGKNNRRHGAEFERDVRKFVEKNFPDTIISRWQNNINLETKEIIQAKSTQWNRGTTGFPDYVIISHWETIFLECKRNGYLKPEEREKIIFLIELGYRVCLARLNENNKIIIDELKP